MRIDNHVHWGFDPLFYLQKWQPYCLDSTRFLQESEGTGIDRFIVFPFIAYMDLDFAALRRNEIRLDNRDDAIPYAFENERLREDMNLLPEEEKHRCLPFLIADPGRKTEEQVRCWEKLPADYRIGGIKIQPTIIQSNILTLLDKGSVILDYAEAHDLPLLIHSSIRVEDKWSQCSDILRVVESRPKVRFVLAHSCRFHLPSLQRAAELPNAWVDCSAHVIHCQCAASNHPAAAKPSERFDSNYESPETVLADLASAFPGKFIWGTDAPFYSIHYQHVKMISSYKREVACLDALSEKMQTEVAYDNTQQWLGRPFDAD